MGITGATEVLHRSEIERWDSLCLCGLGEYLNSETWKVSSFQAGNQCRKDRRIGSTKIQTLVPL
jgi:hypothetical protein